jgi:hypothetical protein
MGDEINKSELIDIAREEGLGNLSRGSSSAAVLDALEGGEVPENCRLDEHRETMERHIKRNWRRIRTQLPTCDGTCVTFGCPDTIVLGCWAKFRNEIL